MIHVLASRLLQGSCWPVFQLEISRYFSFILLCAIFAATVGPSAAQDRQPTAAGVEDDFDRIDRMLDSIESLPEWDHDALLFRIDEQILALHAELAAMADQITAPGADATEFTEAEMALKGWMERAVELSTTRITELNERIHVELSTHDDFAGTPNAIISRAFVQDLRNIRLRHVNSTLDQLDRMETLGFGGVEEVREPLEESLDLTAQRFVGQIRLDSMTLEELRERVAADPDNATLRTALRAVERKQMASLSTLSNVIALQARIGRDTTELRALQAKERGLIGAEILDSGVFLQLLRERLQIVRDDILVNGPVWTLRVSAFVAVLLLTWLVARGVQAIVHRITTHQSVELGQLRERTLVSISFGLVVLVGTVVALSALGVSLVPMLAGLGVASIIVGFALQESLGNLAAGGMILATRPFDLNDRIKVGEAEGRVKDMNLVATTIASRDNKLHIVPNRQIWNSAITNFSRAKMRRVDIKVAVPSGTDVEKVEGLLSNIVNEENRVLRDPAPEIHFGDTNEASVSFWLRAWVETPEVESVAIALKRRILEETRQAGIQIAST